MVICEKGSAHSEIFVHAMISARSNLWEKCEQKKNL